ncbi:MAG: class I SAM-dependent methyltransferase [Halobacteriota archaeon]
MLLPQEVSSSYQQERHPALRLLQSMTPHSPEREDDLDLCLKQIDELFDVQGMLERTVERDDIHHYYVTNKLLQRLWSSDGLFHYGISYDGRFKKDDLREQLRLIERHIRNFGASKVLELGSGLGANSWFLAHRNPNVAFDAIDISNKPLQRYASLPNLSFQFCDYHNLSALRTSYDLVFIIEALCYSTDKPRVFREVKKVLRSHGKFIIFDGYRRRREGPLTQSEERMWGLIAKSFSVNEVEYVDDVEGYMQEEYSLEAVQDFSECVLPSIMRFRPFVRFYFNHPRLGHLTNRIMPFDGVKNTIHFLLLPIGLRRQTGCYHMHVLTNDRP